MRRARRRRPTLARQREFVADASHELRTPLTSVLANLELLEETLQGEARDTAASALRSSRRMRRLVADLLLLARADAGREPPHRPVDLSDVVTDAASELEPVAGDHEISISAPRGLEIDGARDELHRLVLNLMENALRHTDPGTAVEASVERVNGEVVLAVEDDGPGIPPELHDKVFERFFRGAGDRSGSSGLGLSIVRAVADSHQRHGDARAAARRPRRALRRALPGRPLSHSRKPWTFGRCPEGHVRLHFSAARGLLARQRGVRAPHRRRARDHPLHRAPLHRLRRAVDPRRHRPARQDHPDLRPRRPHGPRALPRRSSARS